MAPLISISRTLLEALLAAAAQTPEVECCGLLFGDDGRIADARTTANVAADPARHFEIDPAALFAALRAERAGGARLIGYWHSHPSGKAAPSATDAAMAARDGRLWLIIAGDAAAAWRSGPAGFSPVDLAIEPD